MKTFPGRHLSLLTMALAVIALFIFNDYALAQDNSVKKDSVVVSSPNNEEKTDTAPPKHHHLSEPDKAAIKSAIIPGLGQIDHHDTWWHVPIIYAGFAVFGYFIWWNDTNYINFRDAYRQRIAYEADTIHHRPDVYFPGKTKGQAYPDQGLLDNREYYRRNRDLLIIITSVWYVANIMDAYVFAHLREFDISNDLSMRIEPVNLSLIGNQPVVTCGLKFNLRR